MLTVVIDSSYQVLVGNLEHSPVVFHSQDLIQTLVPFQVQRLDMGLVGDAEDVLQVDCDLDLLGEGYQTTSLRSLLNVLEESQFQWLGRAIQLCRWQLEHRFCGKCGGPTQPSTSDQALLCPSCELPFYPKISPCVIGLVEKGEFCLLARGSRHPEAMFSTLAGFIEAGESAEQAFAREVMEEVGLEVNNIRYLYSQPWPFPGQLMLGYGAEYTSGEIRVDGVEIIEAHWFRWDELPLIPPESTISGRIIRDFVRRHSIPAH